MAIQFSAPILIYEIVTYIQNNEKNLQQGIILLAAVGLSRLVLALFNNQANFLWVDI